MKKWAGKWQPLKNQKNVSHNQVSTKNKADLKSQLNWKNYVQAIDKYFLPAIRYPAGIITWPKMEIEATNIKTRETP